MTKSPPDTERNEGHSGSRPRRKWSAAQKHRIVAETYSPGQSVSMVARRYDVNANQLFSWRRKLARDAGPGLVPVRIVATKEQTSSPVTPSFGVMTIVIPGGISVRVDRDVDDKALGRVLAAIGRLS